MTLSLSWAVLGGFISFAVAFGMGANNVSNAIGTSVGSGALTLKSALILAAVCEFIGTVFMGGGVSDTLKSSIISPAHFENQLDLFAYGMIATMTTAVIWLLIATHYALPISATQTIIGGIVGFAVAENKIRLLNLKEIGVILFSWFLSPIIGAFVAACLYYTIYKLVLEKGECSRFVIPFYYAFTVSILIGFLWYSKFCGDVVDRVDWIIFVSSFLISFFVILWKRHLLKSYTLPVTINPDSPTETESSLNVSGTIKSNSTTISRSSPVITKKDRPPPPRENTTTPNINEYPFKYLMVISAAFMAFAHGSNDASNAAAPYSAVLELYREGKILHQPPSNEVMLCCGIGIVMGLLVWGYKTVELVGEKITKLNFPKGYAAQMSASSVIVIASLMSLPISTTAVLVGSIIGVGLIGEDGIGSGTTVDKQVLLNILGGWGLTLVVGLFGTPIIYLVIRYYAI